MEAPHLHRGWHPDYGFVAASTSLLTDHLRDWALERVPFEPVPGTNLHRLTEPGQDGQRRVRQAVSAIRGLGLVAKADFTLDPELTPDPPRPTLSRLAERQARGWPRRRRWGWVRRAGHPRCGGGQPLR